MDPDSPLPELRTLWNFNDPAASEAAFRAVIPQARQAGDASYEAQLLTQLARAQGLQGRFDDAHRTLDEAAALITPDMTAARMRLLLERGRVFNSSDQPDRARPLFEQAWKLGRAGGEDNLAIDAAHMLAICEKGDTALAWSEEAMALAEASVDPRAKGWLGPLYNNTGWTYHDMGEYEKALTLFRKSLAWREERNDAPGARIGKWCIARALRSLGRIEEALAMQQALLKEYEAVNERDPVVYEEIGECLLALGRPDEARPFFKTAYKELARDTWLVQHEPNRLQRLKELSE